MPGHPAPASIPAFRKGDALLLVDPQVDFCPGGSLPVPDGDAVMPVLSRWASSADAAGIPVLVSRDWHPPTTTHFRESGGAWPPHCIAGTPGAAFHPALALPRNAIVLSKGMGEQEDAYSAFQARDERGVDLEHYLRDLAVRHLYVMGLATDYCVRASVLDARARGFEVTVVQEGVRAVNINPDDGPRALAEMQTAGARLASGAHAA